VEVVGIGMDRFVEVTLEETGVPIQTILLVRTTKGMDILLRLQLLGAMAAQTVVGVLLLHTNEAGLRTDTQTGGTTVGRVLLRRMIIETGTAEKGTAVLDPDPLRSIF